MEEGNMQYIFPDTERKGTTLAGKLLAPIELLLYGILISMSLFHHNLDGIYLSLFFAAVFSLVHLSNCRYRKYVWAKWSFDGTVFHVHIGNEKRSLDISKPFCVSKTMLTFNRRYSCVKYPFIMIWKPGIRPPYEEMNGYAALKKRDALIIPLNEVTSDIFSDLLGIANIPKWPKSRVCSEIALTKTER